jgi:hypothetical protein
MQRAGSCTSWKLRTPAPNPHEARAAGGELPTTNCAESASGGCADYVCAFVPVLVLEQQLCRAIPVCIMYCMAGQRCGGASVEVDTVFRYGTGRYLFFSLLLRNGSYWGIRRGTVKQRVSRARVAQTVPGGRRRIWPVEEEGGEVCGMQKSEEVVIWIVLLGEMSEPKGALI